MVGQDFFFAFLVSFTFRLIYFLLHLRSTPYYLALGWWCVGENEGGKKEELVAAGAYCKMGTAG